MKIGSKFSIDWQPYEIVGTQDYWSRSGRYIEMVVYEAPCADCGKMFRSPVTKTALKHKVLNRRCPRHKSPGRHVPKQKPLAKLVAKRRDKNASLIARHSTAMSAPDLSYLD